MKAGPNRASAAPEPAVPLPAARRAARYQARPYRFSVFPLLLTLLVVAATGPWLIKVSSPLAAFLLACFVAQCTYGAVSAVIAGYRLLSAVFWTFSLCYLAIPALYQVATQQASWGDDFLYADLTRLLLTLIYTNVAFAMFGLGSARFGRQRVHRRGVRPQPTRTEQTDTGQTGTGPTDTGPTDTSPTNTGPAGTWSAHTEPMRAESADSWLGSTGLRRSRRDHWWVARAGLVPTLYCLGALMLLPLVISRTGGLGALVSSRSEHDASLAASGIGTQASGGASVALVSILPGALALAATFVLAMRWRTGDRRGPLVLICAAALLFTYSNPFANTRYVSSVAFVSILFVVLRPRSSKGLALVVLTLVVGVLGVYPLANAFREPGTPVQPVSLATNDFDGFQQMVNAHQYVEQHGHTDGIHLASAALFFLPRSVWEGKAEPASIPVAENRGYDFTNLSLPLPGELYLEFPLVGVAAAMFLWGRGWRRLDEDWADGAHTVAGALVPYLAIAQVGFLRGPVLSLFPIYASAIVFIVLALRESKLRGQPSVLVQRLTNWRRSVPSGSARTYPQRLRPRARQEMS